MKRLRALATVGLIAALGLTQAEQALAQTQQRDQIQYTTLTRQVTGGTPFPVRAIFRTQADYDKFFRLPPQRDRPLVCDFENEVLLLIHLGTQGSQGYSVRVTGVERVYATAATPTMPALPTTVTIKYRITKSGNGTIGVGAAGTAAANASSEVEELTAPAELIKIKKLQRRDAPGMGVNLETDALRFFEEGGMERAGFNVVARTLAGGSGFEQVTVDFSGDVKVRLGGGDAKETRVLLAELERLTTTLQNAQLKSLPRSIPTQQQGARRFFFNHFDGARKRTMVEGLQGYEGAYADRLRPLSETFDLILGRLERRPVRVEGIVETVAEADAVRIQGSLGLSYYLRGPLARKLTVLAGRKVTLEAVAQLRSPTEAEGVIGKVLYPMRSQFVGHPQVRDGQLVIVGEHPMPEIALPLLGPRAQELAGPEIGNLVMLDMWLIFNERGIPTEGFVESILAITLSPVVLRDRAELASLPNGELPERTSVWVSSRQGGATGVALAVGNGKSGWVPSQLLRFTYLPKLAGMADGLNPRNPDSSGDRELRERLEREERDRLNRGRDPNLGDRPR